MSIVTRDNDKQAPSLSRWLWAQVFVIGPDLILLLLFVLLLAVLVTVYGGRFAFVRSSFLLPLFSLVALILVAALTHGVRHLRHTGGSAHELFVAIGSMVRDWSPLVLIIFVYENLHDLTYLIRPDNVDGVLRRIDEAIFGVEPSVALQRVINPWLTEYMTFCYALYFVFPTLVLVALYGMRRTHLFREVGVALSLCCYLGFLGYISVPAIGPRYFIPAELTEPIVGIWLTSRAASVWNAMETVQRDCFPSLHTAMSTISMVYLWRFRRLFHGGRALFGVAAPLIVSLWVSTIYLRYHWFIDVVAGWVLAMVCTWLAPAFIRFYYQRKTHERVQVSLDNAAGRV